VDETKEILVDLWRHSQFQSVLLCFTDSTLTYMKYTPP